MGIQKKVAVLDSFWKRQGLQRAASPERWRPSNDGRGWEKRELELLTGKIPEGTEDREVTAQETV